MKKIVCAVLAVCLFAAGSVSAREIPSSSPERQGFSSDRLDFLTQYMERTEKRNGQWKPTRFTAFIP